MDVILSARNASQDQGDLLASHVDTVLLIVISAQDQVV